MNYFYGELLE